MAKKKNRSLYEMYMEEQKSSTSSSSLSQGRSEADHRSLVDMYNEEYGTSYRVKNDIGPTKTKPSLSDLYDNAQKKADEYRNDPKKGGKWLSDAVKLGELYNMSVQDAVAPLALSGLQKSVGNKNNPNEWQYDADENGKIEAADSLIILQKVKNGEKLPDDLLNKLNKVVAYTTLDGDKVTYKDVYENAYLNSNHAGGSESGQKERLTKEDLADISQKVRAIEHQKNLPEEVKRIIKKQEAIEEREEEAKKKLKINQMKQTAAENSLEARLLGPVIGTGADLVTDLYQGLAAPLEGLGDLATYGVAGVSSLFGADEFAKKAKDFAKLDVLHEGLKEFEDAAEEGSVYGDIGIIDSILEGAGQIGMLYATSGLSALAGLGKAGQTAVTLGSLGLSSMGSGMSEAYKSGATDGEAVLYGMISGAAEAGTELLFGGLGKGVKAIGIGKSAVPVDDILAKKVSGIFKSQLAKNLAEYGIKAGAEGTEEVLSAIVSAWGKSKTYMSEKEFEEILADENLLEQFIVGGIVSGIAQTGGVVQSSKAGADYITGYTQDEQAVIDKEVENRVVEREKDGTKLTKKEIGKIEEQVKDDFEHGQIDIDTIESVLGGDAYTSFRNTVESEEALKTELAELRKLEYGKMNDEQHTRLGELKGMNLDNTTKRNELRTKLNETVFPKIQNSRLAESYNEIARRNETFSVDLDRYEGVQREAVQRAVDSGVLNNTYRSHQLVETLSKIEADKGIIFDYVDNDKLKESGFAIEGKTVNGYANKSDGTVTLNVQSRKAWQSVVGHEITHILELQPDAYDALRTALYEYADSKGELASRKESLTELYKGLDADVEAELTADLVGDYLFTDKKFIDRLTGNRNLFQKVYDEVKYLWSVATGKEKASIEKVKKEFDRAWKELSVKDTNAKTKEVANVDIEAKTDVDTDVTEAEKVKYSLSIKHTNGLVEELADARELTNEQVINYLNQAKSGKLKWNTYIPVRKDTPQVIIDTLKDVGEHVENLSMVMQVRKVQQAMSETNRGNKNAAKGDNRRGHALTAEEIVEIVNNLDNPNTIILQTNRYNTNGEQLPNNVAVFVDYNNNGKEGIAVIEFESSIDTEFIGAEFGDTDYHTVVTVFEPDVERRGEPFDYAEELLLNPDNYDLEIKQRQSEGSAIGKKHPNTSSESPLFENILTENGKDVKHIVKNDFVKSSAETKTQNNISNEDEEFAPTGSFSTPFNTLALKGDIGPVRGTVGETSVKTVADSGIVDGDINDNSADKVIDLSTDNNLVELVSGLRGSEKYNRIRDYILSNLESQEIKLTDGKIAIVNRSDAKHLSHKAGNKKTASIGQLKKIVESAVLVAEEDNIRMNNFKKFYYYEASVKHNNDIFPVYLNVGEALNDGSYHIYDITNKLRDTAHRLNGVGRLSKSIDLETVSLKNSISQKTNTVKSHLIEKASDEAADEKPRRYDTTVDSMEVYSGENSSVEDVDEGGKTDVQEAKTETDAQPKKITRSMLHGEIVDNIKTVFDENGFDFDETLKNAKNLSTFSTVDNIPQRVMEKALGYKEGRILSDLTVNRVAQNETNGIKWLNSFTDRKTGFLAQISKQYDIKPGSKKSAAAQMYAEGFYVNDNNDIVEYGDAELMQDFPDAKVRENIKGLARDPRIRQIYDETLEAINESRTRNAYPEIQKIDNYFLHFRAMEDTFSKWGLPFNPNDIRAKDLPTDLNGVTADLKPGQPYFASAMHRKGKRTSFDLLGGLERYLSSAKNQIYHIDDIQTLRALRNYIADTYGQAKGLEDLDSLSEEETQERIEKVYKSHLSTFAKFLNEEANVLAGKTTLIDRGLEGIVGRRAMTFLDTVRKQTGSNMVGFNVSSSLTNFIPVAQTFAKTNKFDFLKAFTQTVSNKVGSIFGKGDSFTENNPVIIRRKGADRFYRTPYQKVGDVGYVMLGAIDSVSTELIARTKFNELTRKGMSEQQAHFETDKWVSRLMGDRSLGQMPQLYNSKMLGVITQFQLEVRNQLDSQFYDTIQEAKVSNEEIKSRLVRNAKTAAKITSTFVQLAVAQHLFGKAFESIAGYNPAFDIISVLATMFGFDDDEESEDTVLDNVEQGFLELLEDLPYTSVFSGGRIPLSSAMPISGLIKGKDSYGNKKSRWETLGEIAPYYILPGGYGQVKKTVQGLGMFSDEHPVSGSYTTSDNLRFPVEDKLGNRVQAAIFGQYASKNAREYFDNGYAPLKEKQIKEYMDVDLPIADYWKYLDGLKGLKTNAEKADYINGLDIENWQKNILINNILDRKEQVDMSNYDDYGSYEEFDYAEKNPEKYIFVKSVGGYSAYKKYSSDLNDIEADKDKSGKTISGSRKEKVLDYINGLDADYGEKIILYKSEYPSDDTYNMDIVDYLNEREDISYKDMVAILNYLGFVVDDEGNIYWD